MIMIMMDSSFRFHAVMAQKIDVESTLKDVEERLMDEEDANASLGATKKKLAQESGELKKDIEDLERFALFISLSSSIISLFFFVLLLRCRNSLIFGALKVMGP